jgi:hypothetical protein
MKKFISGIVVGVCIGFGIASFLKKTDAAMSEKIEEAGDDEAMTQETEFITKQEEATPTAAKTIVVKPSPKRLLAMMPGPVQEARRPHAEPEEKVKILNIEFSDEQVSTMEQNIDELQKDVSFYRDTQGWIVHFNSQENPMAFAGLKDGDFIRFQQLNELKKDPSKEPLVSRLEGVMQQLQR